MATVSSEAKGHIKEKDLQQENQETVFIKVLLSIEDDIGYEAKILLKEV